MDEAVKTGLQQIAMALAIGLGTIGPGVGIGLVGSKAVEAVGRNPESQSKVMTMMLLGIVFAESLAIFALVITLMVKFI
jgi:F-type H+-transporting ATPase subunit c